MRKIYLMSALMLVVQFCYSQSTRLVLLEEFTGETCPPCASANPGLNNMLDANAGTVISLKYQNDIPSPGPNFYAYNTADIANRTLFYGNNYSPHAFIDGSFWNGNAASVTSTQIINRGAVTSPFEIEVTQTFSPAHDIIYVHAVIRATGPVAISTLKARVAISEKDIYGYTSPNGEDEYQHVMRKMLPTGTGTALPASFAIGDSAVIDVNWTIAVPTSPNVDMPAWARLETIVWVQNDATKEILQTGYVAGAPVPIDPALSAMNGVTAITCGGSVSPVVTATNYEPTAVTSLDIEYYLDAQTPSVYNWTGSIAQGATVNISLPSIPVSSQGVHTVYANISAVNGAVDLVEVNNMVSTLSGVPLTATAYVYETFPNSPAPAADWIIGNADNAATWEYMAVGSPNSAGSIKVNFYDSPQNQIDNLYTVKAADLTNAVTPTLTFKMAHRRYSASYSDRLDVLISTDCGQNWTSVWNKSGAALATVATFQTSAYNAPTAAQWRLESIPLDAYIGMTDVLFAFKATSGFGNNLFVDEINVNPVPVGIESVSSEDNISLYPMPSNGNLTLNTEKLASDKLSVVVTSITGQVVKEMNLQLTGKEIQLDLTQLESGTYFASFKSGDQTFLKKIVIEK